MKKFTTLFYLGLENVHLIKDVGQIPYNLTLKYPHLYNSTIITPKITDDYPYLKTETPGIEIVALSKKFKIKYIYLSIFIYLFKNAKNIDVLNLYHFSPYTLIYIIFYKLINPLGFVYLKLDHDTQSFINNGYKLFNFNNKSINYFLKLFENLLIRKSDLISAETDFFVNELMNYNPLFKNKLIKISNGIDFYKLQENLPTHIYNFNEKENLIITSGRIGVYQKNTELLLEIISTLELKNWKIILIGKYEKNFEEKILNFYKNFPDLKQKVSFIGNIENRQKYFSLFNKAKIFLITSRQEGFPLVFSEAICLNNYIISTKLDSISDILKNYKNAGFSGSKDDIKNHIQGIINGEIDISYDLEKRNFFSRKYHWNNIIDIIHLHLTPHLGKE